ncbi:MULTISPECIES: glycosyltransferase family 2 protein [unclassified Frankia]
MLVRCHGIPIGQLEASDGGDTNAATIPMLVKECRLDQHECSHSWPMHMQERRRPASIVIPTRDRPESLGRLISSLQAVAEREIEFLIIDNAPRTAATRELVESVSRVDARFRYLCEPRKGASRARNTGLGAAEGRAVAFLDDDTQVDRHWLPAILSGFDVADGVACVTGLVLPDELMTSAQIWFEQYGGFGKGLERRIFDRWSGDGALYPYAAGAFGSGNNVAFDVDAVRELGGFNEVLGPGTPTHAGEDLELFTRTIRSGRRLVYEPSAIVYHTHRQRYGDLLDQLRNYGTGLSAMLMAQALSSPQELAEILRRVPAGLLFLLLPRSSKNVSRGPRFPVELVLTEVLGIASGPFAYLQARRTQSRRVDRGHIR